MKAFEYLKGLVQSEKSNMEKMAEVVPNVEYQALQQFLSDSPWDHQTVMNRVAKDVNRLLNGEGCSLLLDESSIPKKGDQSVGVARQWCGRLGKLDNCQVGVFAALSKKDDVCLVDAELFLPEAWIEDVERCDKARVPKARRILRTKINIALDLVKRAQQNGLHYEWVSADSFYGRDKGFLRSIDGLGETFVMDIPVDFTVYLKNPKPRLPQAPARGRAPTKYKSGRKSVTVKEWLESKPERAWKKRVFREGSQGKMAVEAIQERVWIWDGKTEEVHCWHLVARREIDDKKMIKISISNAPERTSLKKLLYMQGQRHFIERGFQDAKSQLGLDEYQARNWYSWHHHMALIMMAMSFIVYQKIIRKQYYPLYTVADVVFLLVHTLPGRIRTSSDAESIIAERHRKRKQAMESHAKNE